MDAPPRPTSAPGASRSASTTGRPARLAPLHRAGRHGDGRRRAARGSSSSPSITDDLEEAVAGADLVMLAVPISAHPFFAQDLAECSRPTQVAVPESGSHGRRAVPGPRDPPPHGPSRRPHVRGEHPRIRVPDEGPGNGQHPCTMTPTFRSPHFPGRQQAGALRASSRTSTPPSSRPVTCSRPGSSTSTRSSIRPQIICNAGWLEHTEGDYLFYYEGTTPSVGRVIDALDEERLRGGPRPPAFRPNRSSRCSTRWGTRPRRRRASGTASRRAPGQRPQPLDQGSAEPRSPLPPRGRRLGPRPVVGAGQVAGSAHPGHGRPDHRRVDSDRPRLSVRGSDAQSSRAGGTERRGGSNVPVGGDRE